MSDQQNIKKELVEGFEIFAIRKTLRSLLSFIRNPRQVVDSIYQGKDEYVKPVRFILTIGAPALLILNLFDLDVRGALEQYITVHMGSSNNPDPLLRFTDKVLIDNIITYLSKIVGEYNPLMYFGVAPIVALIIRKIHPDKSLTFYFFLTLSWYMLGVYCLLDLTETVILSATGWHMPLIISEIESLLRFLFSIYLVACIMPGDWTERLPKGLLSIVLGWVTMFGFLIVIMLIVLVQILNADWVPDKAMGYKLMKISDSLRQVHGIEVKEGLFVKSVEPYSPAERAGVLNGDVLVSLGNKPITRTFKSERIALDAIPIGDSASLVINRKGMVMNLRVLVLPWDSVFRKGDRSQ